MRKQSQVLKHISHPSLSGQYVNPALGVEERAVVNGNMPVVGSCQPCNAVEQRAFPAPEGPNKMVIPFGIEKFTLS